MIKFISLGRVQRMGFAAAVCLTAVSLLPATDAEAAAIITISQTPSGVLFQGSGDGLTVPAISSVDPTRSASLEPFGAWAGPTEATDADFFGVTFTGGPISTGCLDDNDNVKSSCYAVSSDPNTGPLLGAFQVPSATGGLFLDQSISPINGGTIPAATLASISTLWAGKTYYDLGLIPDASITFTLIGTGDTLTINVAPSPVPVPAALWLFGSALGFLGWMRRKTA
jgi:hypothetical protein